MALQLKLLNAMTTRFTLKYFLKHSTLWFGFLICELLWNISKLLLECFPRMFKIVMAELEEIAAILAISACS
jgi:hypothetical protein